MSTDDDRQGRVRYRFGRAESLGIVGTARVAQCVVVLAGVGVSLVLMYALPLILSPLAFLALAVSGVLAFLPVRGRPLVDWTRLRVAHQLDALRGRTRWRRPRGGAPQQPGEGRLDTPDAWGQLRIVAAPYAKGYVGVLVDERAQTASATMLVRTESFALLADADQERRVAAWGSVLASLARESGGVRRIGWTERTVPAEADEIASYFASERDRDVPLDHQAVLSYVELIESGTAAVLDHECFVTIQIDLHKRRRETRQRESAAGSQDLAAAGIVVDELRLVAHALADAGIGTVGALPPRLLAASIRHAVDPAARPHLARLAAAGADEGCAPAAAGPLAIDEAWDCVRTDSGWHATFWVERWPMLDVGCLFLAPLLNRTSAQRAVSVVAEPIAPSRAHRQAEHATTREEGDQLTREKHGFLETARQRRGREDVQDRERELADGHALLRFAGHITVTAPTRDELEGACAEVVQQAQHSHLELRRLVGEQAAALASTLPGLCRGLA
jgi:hypothetical protein